jgi:hypothetical protein
MDELLQTTLNDPFVGTIVTAVMGMIVINHEKNNERLIYA